MTSDTPSATITLPFPTMPCDHHNKHEEALELATTRRHTPRSSRASLRGGMCYDNGSSRNWQERNPINNGGRMS